MKEIIEIRKGIKTFVKIKKEVFVNINDTIKVITEKIDKAKIKNRPENIQEWKNYFTMLYNNKPEKFKIIKKENYINIDWLRNFFINNKIGTTEEDILVLFTSKKFIEKIKDMVEKAVEKKINEKK